MTRFADGPVVEVSVSIRAPLEIVWNLVSDINLPARFQDEFVEADWIDEGPAKDARFVGRNQKGDRRWETTSWLVVYELMKAFGWAVSDRDNPGATWTFLLEESDSGTAL
ncbi:MAG: SRPBCC family protein, partial [Acidimicrobiia bacterium]